MYEVKFAYQPGCNLVFSAFQPCGTGRGIEQQPLPEIRPTGYYVTTPITDLVAGDMVLVYELESVLWEDVPVYISTEDYIYYEDDKVHWEGEWLVSVDDSFSDIVTWCGDPIGSGEYSSAIDISDDLVSLIAGQTMVTNVYPVSTTGEGTSGGAVARARQLDEQDVGYFKRKRIEKYG